MLRHQPLDPEQLQNWRDMLSGDEQTVMIRDLLDTFLSESTSHLAALHSAVQAGDRAACRDQAHRILNDCAVIGAGHMRDLCAEIEALTRVESPELARIGQLLI